MGFHRSTNRTPPAVGCYLHHGFRVIGRSELESMGSPYALLRFIPGELPHCLVD
jgi:hypothetical protein